MNASYKPSAKKAKMAEKKYMRKFNKSPIEQVQEVPPTTCKICINLDNSGISRRHPHKCTDFEKKKTFRN